MMKRLVAVDGAAWVAMTALLCGGSLVVALFGGLAPGSAWSSALDWRPNLGLHQPWRLWTAAWVHWSAAHLAVNLVGAAVVAAVGWRARASAAAALAWFIAWPLTQVLMAIPDSDLLSTAMQHYGGLSGVLHAGAIVLGLTLAWPGRGRVEAAATPPPGPGFVASKASSLETSRITEGPWAMTSLEESLHTLLPASTFEPMPDPALTPEQATRHRWIGAAITAGTVAKVLLETPWQLALRQNAMLGIDVAPIAHVCGIAAGAIAWGLVTALMATQRPPRS